MKLLNYCLSLIDDDSDNIKFNIIYPRYKNLMFKTANDVLNDEYAAEDAVSDAFISIAKHMYMIGDPSSKETRNFVCKVAKNYALNALKKKKRFNECFITLDEIEDVVFSDTSRREELVAEAVELLSDSYRLVIELRYRHKYTNREIASLLNYSVDKVNQIVSRARKDVRRMLEAVEANES